MKNILKSLASLYLHVNIILPFIIVVLVFVTFFLGGWALEYVPQNHLLQDVVSYSMFFIPLVVILSIYIGLFISSNRKRQLEANPDSPISTIHTPKKKSMFKDVILLYVLALPGMFGVSLIFNIMSEIARFNRDGSTMQSSVRSNYEYGIFFPNIAGIVVCVLLIYFAYKNYKEIKLERAQSSRQSSIL